MDTSPDGDLHFTAINIPDPPELLLECGLIIEELQQGAEWTDERLIEAYGFIKAGQEVMRMCREYLDEQLGMHGMVITGEMKITPPPVSTIH